MLGELQKKATSFLSNNASALLTAGGVAGTVTTAVLAGRASFKASAIIQGEYESRSMLAPELSKTEKAKLVWPYFIPPVISGMATIGSIVMANRMSAQRAAALAAAYGVSSRQLDEYKAKLEEKLGVKKAEQARDEIQQDRIDRRPLGENVIVVGTGPVLCYDAFSDRYFKSTADHIRKAERVVSGDIETGGYSKLGLFYDELGLPSTQFDDMLGWNIQNPCKIVISAMMMNDDACLCLEFVNLPMPDYGMDYN